MTTNNKISNLVSTQLPDFVRADHQNFVAFLEAYYEYLEQSNTTIQFGKTVERAKNMLNYLDIDTTIDGFAQKFYNEFLSLIPKDVAVDKTFILKNVKDFYRARGTEKSFRFLFRTLFNEEPEFYYPKNDILIASSGKWFIERSLRITGMTGGDSLTSLQQFINTKISGSTSGASAIVERVLVSYEGGEQVFELYISDILGTFANGEGITTTDVNGNVLTATILSGRLNTITVTNQGSGYAVGDPLVFTGGGTGSGAAATVSQVSSGNVSTVLVNDGGAGFAINDLIIFTGGGGSGANAKVGTVLSDNTVHPSIYSLNNTLVSLYSSTVVGAYSNGAGGNANTSLINTLTFFTITGLGPITSTTVTNSGNNYISIPSADAVGNTMLKNLGIIGKLRIVSGGSGYANGDLLTFTNPPGGYGVGANANVTVNGTGAIVKTTFTTIPGFLAGGTGYDPLYLPSVSVTSVGGSGANIQVASLIAFGSPSTNLVANTTTVGKVEAIAISSRGSNYSTPPTISITTLTGDGTAQAVATVSTGVFTYPGRFLDDTGFPSGFNFLQDRDYYQNYAYVVRVKESIENYRTYLKNILTPAGMKLWGDYLLEAPAPLSQTIVTMANTVTSNFTFFTANAVNFSSSYLYANSQLSNSNISMQGTFSVWINPSATPSTNTAQSYIYFAGNTNSSARFAVTLANNVVSANNYGLYVQILGKDGTGANVLVLKTNTSTVITKNNWIHILSSWDLSNSSKRHLYITNVASINAVTYTANANVTHNVAFTGVAGDQRGAGFFSGDMAELWYNDSYIDLSNVTNRQKFISTQLLPVDLGANGSAPTGTRPIQYLRFAGTNFANSASEITNNLSISGTITVANTSPSSI